MTDNEARYKEALEKIRAHHTDGYGVGVGNTYTWANEALNPPPEYEEVEVVAWKWNYDKGPIPVTCPEFIAIPPTMRDIDSWIEMRGTYLRPIPQKVKRREEIERPHSSTLYNINHIPSGAKFFAEWLE